MRSLAANLRSLYLRSWRYGPETERLVAEALEREQWSHEQWKTWQEERRVTDCTAPPRGYRIIANNGRHVVAGATGLSGGYLENWPILEADSPSCW
jgi:phenylacetate-CoA ligase